MIQEQEQQAERLNASLRDHSREAKPRRCRGCGEKLPAYILHTHEAKCRRDHIQAGDRFKIMARTTVGGIHGDRGARREIEVEVVSAHGPKGYIVRSLLSGRLIVVKSIRRFLNWDDFEPGLTRTPKRKFKESK